MPSTANAPILVVEEISRLAETDRPERDRLNSIVSYLKRAMKVDVCTLYRSDSGSGDLYLESTDGLSQDRVGRMALRKGEGLTGVVVQSRKPLAVRDGPSHPSFRFVPGLMEETYHSFLGVPLTGGRKTIGALVVQTAERRDFHREDIALMNTVSRQIGALAGDLFADLDREIAASESEAGIEDAPGTIRGRSLAPGCFAGPPLSLERGMRIETVYTPPSRGVETEKKMVRKANVRVITDLEREARAIIGSEGQAILKAHRVILEDEEMANETLGRIEKGDSAAEAVRQTVLRWVRLLESQPNPSFAMRAADLRDIGARMLRALGIEAMAPSVIKGKAVAVARSILPGELLRVGPGRIGALIITDQGIYSHLAILARSFDIPAVQVDAKHLEDLFRTERLLVDGSGGIVVIEPTPEIASQYVKRAERLVSLPEGGPEDLSGPVETPDGTGVSISLNAGLAGDFDEIESYGPDGIGLYRTEIPFMSRETFPGLRPQMDHYKRILRLANGRPVTFRTFDFGGDKVPASLRFEPEDNPMMGNRSTRFMLANDDLFATQLKALLRVSALGPMSILLPLIATPEELNLVLDLLNSIKNELDRAGTEFDREIKVGIMLEVPSVIFMLDNLSRLSDFYCVGSNDLVQYLMAADRSNPRVSRLYQWHHPAVLAVLAHLVKQCRRNNRPITLCGEMASHPWAAMLLVGMGYDHLSVDHHSIPIVKWTLRQAPASLMKKLADSALEANGSTEVIELFFGMLGEIREHAPPLAKLLSTSVDRLRSHALW